MPLETHACVASYANGQVTIWAATQIPYNVRSPAGRGVPAAAVEGPRHRADARRRLRRQELPEDRADRDRAVDGRAQTGAPRPHPRGRVRDYHQARRADPDEDRPARDGTIVARKIEAHFNTGAYADIGPRLIKNGGYGTGGPTEIPNVWIDSYAVYTNLPPAGAFRGYGISQAAWAYETQVDMIAERLGIDPLEFRMRNLLEDGDTVMTGEPMEDAHFKELLRRRGADRMGCRRRSRSATARRSREGLGCIIKGTVTPSTSTAVAKLNEDGSLDVLTSSVEMGQGILTRARNSRGRAARYARR